MSRYLIANADIVKNSRFESAVNNVLNGIEEGWKNFERRAATNCRPTITPEPVLIRRNLRRLEICHNSSELKLDAAKLTNLYSFICQIFFRKHLARRKESLVWQSRG